jgi:hypothetical protein
MKNHQQKPRFGKYITTTGLNTRARKGEQKVLRPAHKRSMVMITIDLRFNNKKLIKNKITN